MCTYVNMYTLSLSELGDVAFCCGILRNSENKLEAQINEIKLRQYLQGRAQNLGKILGSNILGANH